MIIHYYYFYKIIIAQANKNKRMYYTFKRRTDNIISLLKLLFT